MPLYFAYGSNMDLHQMVSRCPSAKVLGVGILEGYRVIFPLMSSRWVGGAASVEPAMDLCVEGVVYEMDMADFEPLDRFEGVAKKRYDRRLIGVKLVDGREVEAEVYIANPELGGPFAPDPRYLDLMIGGAEKHGLSDSYIALLKTIETTNG